MKRIAIIVLLAVLATSSFAQTVVNTGRLQLLPRTSAAKAPIGSDVAVFWNDPATGNVFLSIDGGDWFAISVAGSTTFPVPDSTILVAGNVDPSKTARFEVDGFAATAARVFSLPDVDTMLAGLSVAQTWTAAQTFGDVTITGTCTGCGSGGATSPLTTKGDIWTFSTTDDRLPLGTNGQVLKVNTATTTGLEWAADAGGTTSPLTTKGDLWGFSTLDVRIPVGTDGQVLKADSASASGVSWGTDNTGGGGGILTTKGDVLTHSGAAEVRLPVGTDGYVLTARASAANGVAWEAPTGGAGTVAGAPSPYRREAIGTYVMGSTTLYALGQTVGEVGGGKTVVYADSREYVNCVSQNVAAGGCGMYNLTVGEKIRTSAQPILSASVRSGSTSVEQTFWIGFSSTNPSATSDPAGAHLAAFRYDTVSSDPNWMACTKDGTTLSCTNTGVAFATNTSYDFQIDATDPAAIDFSVNGSIVATKTTNLPSTSTGLNWVAVVNNRAATIVQKDWSIARVHIGFNDPATSGATSGTADEPPTSSGWTWINQGTSTVTDVNGVGMTLRAQAGVGSDTNSRMLVRAITAGTDFTFTARYRSNMTATGGTIVGIGVMNSSTGRWISYGRTNANATSTNNMTDYTTYSSQLTQTYPPAWGTYDAEPYVRIRRASGSIYLEISADGSVWEVVASTTVAAWLSDTDRVAFFVDPQVAATASLTAIHYSLTQ